MFVYAYDVCRACKIRTTREVLFCSAQTQCDCSGTWGQRWAKKEHRRVQWTRQLLREALFALIRERGFESLSVQDIIARANVGRATFYAHFDNKEDLLLSGFDELQVSLKQQQREARSRPNVDQRVFAFSHDLLVHASEHSDLFRAMVGKRSGAVVQQVIHKMLLDLVRDDVKAMGVRSDSYSIPTEAVAPSKWQFLRYAGRYIRRPPIAQHPPIALRARCTQRGRLESYLMCNR